MLESCISEKRFTTAVESLQEGLQLLQSPQLQSVAALADMKVYMSNQQQALVDILIEELHNHLYLKSPYCEHRWVAYAATYKVVDEPNDRRSGARELFDFLDHLDASDSSLEDGSHNPEISSFKYIRTIVESLHQLGRLEDVVDIVEQRLPLELFRIVERSNVETHQQYPNAGKEQTPDRIDFDAFVGPSQDSVRGSVLNDLLGTFYAKFEAIAESYRAFHEVIRGICEREETYDTPRMTRSFEELWKLYQSEIRSLLHGYLSANGSTDRLGHGLMSEENVFRQQRDRLQVCSVPLQN